MVREGLVSPFFHMTTFKKMIEKDIEEVFLNLEEFADFHDINGQKIKCVIDTDLTQRYGNWEGDFQRYGVIGNQIRVFVHAPDLVPAPVHGQLLSVDDSHHRVDSVSSEDGVLVIVASEVNE